ncbi:ATP-binding protein [Alteromonas aestuariivivens]|uniref:ATP-binding protein n=1 Tax=Alteromonas aestuariivivens TaxID=1938339 RepID=A0A3D8M6N6_9ALTE|nr:ATP-binding protein [Alteromonas aestuariivivens]RDV25214.1 ATP-binding protein [Alteromonas aestuariivivens]
MAGLKRIILIDTHLPGVVELKLDGHTNICGTNASGKTTLQRLIPVFYGEYPSRVVPATRDSFERWYLPRTSSFIIYEYTRAEGDLCQAVLSSNGTGVNYRFIGKPFDIDDYLFRQKNGKHSSIGSAELARAMKRNNVLVTSLLNTKDFRAILQNDHGVLNQSSNARELLGYAKIFSLCQPNLHVRHIEKLAKAVHSKEGKMETIKAMIAAILEEDGVQPPTSNLSRNRVDDWLKECQLIKQFDKIRPEFAKLEQADMALNTAESQLSGVKQYFELDKTHLAARVESTKNALDENQFQRKHNDSQWSESRDGLNQVVSSCRADVEKYTSELDAVEDEFQAWQEQNIEQLKEDVANLPQWQNELELVSSRYALLTEKHQDIESAYNRRVAELGDKLSLTLEQLSAARQEAADKRSEQQQKERDALQRIRDDYSSQMQQLNQQHQEQLSSLKVAEAEFKAALNNAGYNEFEQSQLELLDAAIKEASINEDAARSEYRQAQQAHQKVLHQRNDASQNLDKARLAFQREEKNVEKIRALLYPGEGSLLEFLRGNLDNWEQSLGKVIRPELLERCDLAPKLAGDKAGLLGVELALEALDTPEYAQTEQALKQQLADAEGQQQKALELQNECEAALAKANEEVRNAELAMTQKDNSVRSAESTRKRAQQDRDAVLSEYQQALSARKQKAKSKLEANGQAQKQRLAQYELARDELRDQQREAETEHRFHWQQLIADTDARIGQLDSDMKKARESAARDRKETELWLQNELNQRGVDVDEIGQLKKRVKALKEDIYRTESQRHKVADYERWYLTVFTGHKMTWQTGLAKARKELAEAERSLASKQSEYRDLREQLKEQQVSLEATLKTAVEQLEQVDALRRSLAKLNLHSAEISADVKHDDVSIAQRLSQAQSLMQEREELLSDVRNYVERFDQLIAAQAGTGLSDTWERAREECAVINAHGVKGIDHRRMVSHLAQLLNVIVPQKLQGLKEQGRIFGADLSQYYFVLADIDKRIVSQSRRITKEVDGELFLDGVSDSAVKIRSRISELEFWPELEQFRDYYQRWMDEGANELPEEEYGQSMRRVLDILGRAALTGGISKLLDIELHLREGNSDLVIRTDRQLNESSSHGMAYLILCKFLLAFTRLLRGEADATIHWPIDELGTLHQSNVKKIFDACQNNNISVVGAFPNPESDVLTLFENRYLIDKVSRQLQVVEPKVSTIAQRIQARREQQEVSA